VWNQPEVAPYVERRRPSQRESFTLEETGEASRENFLDGFLLGTALSNLVE
jgi:hypothetical protein